MRNSAQIYVSQSTGTGIVSVDWYAMSCRLGAPYDGRRPTVPSGMSIIPCKETAVWGRRWFIMDSDGNKVATLLAEPRSKAIAADRALVEVANQYLYSEDFEHVVDICLSSLPMVCDGMNRVDLCCDFEMTDSLWNVVAMMVDSEVYLKGLRKGVIWWSSNGPKRVPHQLSWGGRDSVFKWKLYNKYKELHDGGTPDASKPYIEDMWRAAGMVPQRVWRLEVSLQNTNRLEFVETSGRVHYLDWFRLRVPLYRAIYADKFVLRLNEGHKDKRNDPIVTFLDLQEPKALRHGEPKGERMSDPERRVVCKMWKEYRDNEVRADDFLVGNIRDFLIAMFQLERNIAAVEKRFGLSRTEVFEALVPD